MHQLGEVNTVCRVMERRIVQTNHVIPRVTGVWYNCGIDLENKSRPLARQRIGRKNKLKRTSTQQTKR